MMFSLRRTWIFFKLLLLTVAAAFSSHGFSGVPARFFASAILRFWAEVIGVPARFFAGAILRFWLYRLELVGVAFFAVAVAIATSWSDSAGGGLVFCVFAIGVTAVGGGDTISRTLICLSAKSEPDTSTRRERLAERGRETEHELNESVGTIPTCSRRPGGECRRGTTVARTAWMIDVSPELERAGNIKGRAVSKASRGAHPARP